MTRWVAENWGWVVSLIFVTFALLFVYGCLRQNRDEIFPDMYDPENEEQSEANAPRNIK